jgi:hypothetical protein
LLEGAIPTREEVFEQGPEALLEDYERRRAQADILRDLFGNPFRPVSVDPAWLAWQGGAVRSLAQAIHDDQAFHLLPVLADALEDAGCAERQLLEHCRQPGVHVPGCWVLERLRDKVRG